MAEANRTARRPSGAGRRHPAGAQPVAHADAPAGRRHHPASARWRRLPSPPSASRPTSSARSRSPASASACSRCSRCCSGVWLVRPLRPARHRPAGRALRRRARAVAAGRDSERGRPRRGVADGATSDVPPVIVDKLVAQAIEKCEDDRRRPADRPRRHAAARRGAGRDRRRSARCCSCRPGVPAPGRVGAAGAVEERRGRQPVRDHRAARRRRSAEGIGSDDHREARRLPVERRRRVGEGRGRARSSRACRSSRPATTDKFEGMLFDVKAIDDVLRRGRRREVADLHDDGRRAAGRRRRSRWSTSIRRTPASRRRRSKSAATSRRSPARKCASRSRRRWRRPAGGCSSIRRPWPV